MEFDNVSNEDFLDEFKSRNWTYFKDQLTKQEIAWIIDSLGNLKVGSAENFTVNKLRNLYTISK